MDDSFPARLYKYQPYNTQTLDNLKNRTLWFSKPANFNDPFDISIRPLPGELADDEWVTLYEQRLGLFLKTISAPPEGVRTAWEEHYLTNGKPNQAFREMAISSSSFIWEMLRKYNQKSGVACFSRNNDNLLMWAHYSDGHRGFCLEFDTSFPPFNHAVRVEYCDKYPGFNLKAATLGDEMPNVPLLTTKSMDWSYEEEWRIVLVEGDQGYHLDSKALTGVYFGCAMPPEHEEIIGALLKGSTTRLYQMVRSKTKFRVDPYIIESDVHWKDRAEIFSGLDTGLFEQLRKKFPGAGW